MHIELGTAIFQLVVFLILFLILRKYAFGPLMSVMEKRAQYIEEQISSADNNRAEIERLAEEHRSALQNAKKDAHDILENARRTSEKQAADMKVAAEEEVRRIREEATAEIQREKEAAIAELKEQVGTLSVLLAGKIITKELDAASHKALFDEAVKEMGVRV